MSLFAANAIPVKTDWTTFPLNGTFQYPFNTLDAFVNGIDVICQISEADTGTLEADQSKEILLRIGFQSRPLPDFYAVRFKAWSGSAFPGPGTIDFTLRT